VVDRSALDRTRFDELLDAAPRQDASKPIILLTTKWAIDAPQTTQAPPTSPLVTNTQLF